MGVSLGSSDRRVRSRTTGVAPLVAFLGLFAPALIGCQGVKPIQTHRIIEHQALIDFSGLKPGEAMDDLKVNAAVPSAWEAMPLQKTALYTFGQWRSPSTRTGVGAAHIRLPLPLSADLVLWFAKREYTKKADDGKLIGQWTDELGRSWFEAENGRYHVRGYALAQGFDAWIVYLGYKLNVPPDPTEISQAARSADTFVPLVSGVQPLRPPATGPSIAPAIGGK